MIRTILCLLTALLFPFPATAAVSVFACEPEWAALATEIGGDRVQVTSATTAFQDPHHIQARPSLIARMRRADLAVCTGAELEAGWLPLLLRRANNPRVQPGRPGYLEAADYVPLLERPERVDRAHGDVHSRGNPHIHLDPRNLMEVARELAVRLSAIDAGNAVYYRHRLDDFLVRWQAAIGKWTQDAASLEGKAVVVYHRNWVYLLNWFGLERAATIEPKPGIPPGSADLAELVKKMKQQPAAAILRAHFRDQRASRWLGSRTGIPEVELPFTVGASDRARDLFGWFDDIVDRLVVGVK